MVLFFIMLLVRLTSAQPETTTPAPDEVVKARAWELRGVDCRAVFDAYYKCLVELRLGQRPDDCIRKKDWKCRLEIFFHGKWGSVCNNLQTFRQNEANTACRQLGYFAATTYKGYGKAFTDINELSDATHLTSPVWLDGLRCRPTDSSLQSCDHSPIGVNNCSSHVDDMAVTCRNEESYDVRLVNSSSTNAESGRLEVFTSQGVWGTVCDSSGTFQLEEANVVCRQLGYTSPASRYGYVKDLGFEPLPYNSSTQVWVYEIECNHRGDHLFRCRENFRTSSDCDGHSLDVAVDCRPSTSSNNYSSGIAVGVVISFLFICVCLQGCVACIYFHTKKKRPSPETQPYPRSSFTFSIPPAASPSAPPRAEQAMPLQAKNPPLPDTTLQEAPPPSYSEAAAYPPPSRSKKPDPTPYIQQSECNSKLHHELDEIHSYQQTAVGSDSTTLPSAPPHPVGLNGPPYPDSIPSAPPPT